MISANNQYGGLDSLAADLVLTTVVVSAGFEFDLVVLVVVLVGVVVVSVLVAVCVAAALWSPLVVVVVVTGFAPGVIVSTLGVGDGLSLAGQLFV